MNLELRNSGKEEANQGGFRAWLAAAWISALFCLAVGATLIFLHATATNSDPWKSPQLLALKAQLAAAPKDEQIKRQIRELDLKFRQRYFHRLVADRTGGWLLLAGVGAFLVAARRAAKLRGPLSLPDAAPDPQQARQRQAAQAVVARRAVAATGFVVFASLVTASLVPSSKQPVPTGKLVQAPGREAQPNGDAAPATSKTGGLPTLAEFQANWPVFRGPHGNGSAPKASAPLHWDEQAGSGILWKSDIPAPGFNTPIVWGNRVFISGGTAAKREVFCYNADDGKLLWQRPIENVPGSPQKQPELSENTGFAAPTMASDGQRAYVIFANGDLAAVTFDGTLAWVKNLGVPKNMYGHATSLATWQGNVIVQFDQGESDPANSRLIAFDGASGRVVWEKERKVASSWASPIIVEAAGKPQIITLSVPWVIAYSATDGAELWRAEVLDGEIAPSPILTGSGGFICAISPGNKMTALRPNGSGDVTKTQVVWTSDENIPDVASPASNGELIFYITSAGMLTCLDAKDGKKVWEHDFGTEIQASPGIAGNALYIVATDGKAFIVEAGREYKELGSGAAADKFFASPAFANGRLYLRGNARLYCIGEKGASTAKPQ